MSYLFAERRIVNCSALYDSQDSIVAFRHYVVMHLQYGVVVCHGKYYGFLTYYLNFRIVD